MPQTHHIWVATRVPWWVYRSSRASLTMENMNIDRTEAIQAHLTASLLEGLTCSEEHCFDKSIVFGQLCKLVEHFWPFWNGGVLKQLCEPVRNQNPRSALARNCNTRHPCLPSEATNNHLCHRSHRSSLQKSQVEQFPSSCFQNQQRKTLRILKVPSTSFNPSTGGHCLCYMRSRHEVLASDAVTQCWSITQRRSIRELQAVSLSW